MFFCNLSFIKLNLLLDIIIIQGLLYILFLYFYKHIFQQYISFHFPEPNIDNFIRNKPLFTSSEYFRPSKLVNSTASRCKCIQSLQMCMAVHGSFVLGCRRRCTTFKNTFVDCSTGELRCRRNVHSCSCEVRCRTACRRIRSRRWLREGLC